MRYAGWQTEHACIAQSQPDAVRPAVALPLGSSVARVGAVLWQVSFCVEARDQYGNKRTRGGDKVALLLVDQTLASDVTFSVLDQQGGTYRCTFRSAKAGTVLIRPMLNGELLGSSTGTVAVVIAAAPCHAASCRLANAVSGFTADQPVLVQLQTTDVYGNLADPCSKPVALLQAAQGAQIIPGELKRASEGAYNVEFVALVSGMYTLRVMLGSEHVAGSPSRLEILPGRLCLQRSVLSVATTAAATAGEPLSALLIPMDANGNRLRAHSLSCEAVLRGAETSNARISSLPDGSFHISYQCSVSGTYELHAMIEGRPLAQGPCKLSVGPAETSVAHCVVSGSGLHQALAGERSEILITCRDRFANARACGGDHLRLHTSGPGGVDSVIKDNGDGTYICSYTALISGRYSFSVHLSTAELVTSTVHILPAQPFASRCTAKGLGLLVDLVAGNRTALTVQMRDRFGNQCNEGRHGINASISGYHEVDPEVLDHGDGCYEVSFTADVQGEYDLAIDHKGDPIKGSPFRALLPLLRVALHPPVHPVRLSARSYWSHTETKLCVTACSPRPRHLGEP
jgi:hypothetical protein